MLYSMLLKPNMVIAGEECTSPAPAEEVAVAALRRSRQYVPAAVPGIVFLSRGQDDLSATAHLDAINRARTPGRRWRRGMGATSS